MQIRNLSIRNFRGISELDWSPSDKKFCCIVGSGDSGKSTILDAVELTLSSKWYAFSESDFLSCDTSKTLSIEVTVGELSKELKSDDRFGLYIRGWQSKGTLRDEPEDDDEPVLTVRLTVDSTLEPVWELVCDRLDSPRTLSNRDKTHFGLVRLAGDDSRHLAWGQGSVLSRLTGDKSEAAALLAQAYKTARDGAELDKIVSLSTASKSAESSAKSLGAYVDGEYRPGLELGRSGISAGSIALHDGGVPLRLAGLGTKRLATLAIQRSAIVEGAIVLIDEIEHGLEPHRIIGAISQLKSSQAKCLEEGKPVGQILLTTHSDTALVEAGADSLFICHTNKADHKAGLVTPMSPEPVRDLLRFNPKALLARKILVTEGSTEVGIILGLRSIWATRHDDVSFEQLGVAVADGNGDQAASRAIVLARLGFKVAIFRDSDKSLATDVLAELKANKIDIFQYEGEMNTEDAIFTAANSSRVETLLNYMRQERGEDSINDSVHPKIYGLDVATAKNDFGIWSRVTGFTEKDLKKVLVEIATRQKWFKDSRISREIAPVVWGVISDDLNQPVAKVMHEIEAWVYA